MGISNGMSFVIVPHRISGLILKGSLIFSLISQDFVVVNAFADDRKQTGIVDEVCPAPEERT